MPPKQQPGSQRANPFAPNITPLPQGTNPPVADQQRRITIVRYRLGRIAGWTDRHIQQLLEANGWDVDAAINQYHRDLLFMRADAQANVPGHLAQERAELELQGAGSVHQNHRVAIQQLHDTLRNADPNNAQRINRLTTLRLANHLNENDWDLDRASDAFLTTESDPNAVAEAERRDRRLRITPPGATQPNTLHRDERLALLLDFAGTDDWVSVRDHLASHQWDLHRACDSWIRSGIRRTQASIPELRRTGYHAPQMPHTESDNRWLGRTSAPQISGIDDSDRQDARLDYGDQGHEKRNGWTYHAIHEKARAGIPFPEKTYFNKIDHGKGVRLQWRGPVQENTNSRLDMDWNDPDHVSVLNKWYGQLLGRTQGRMGVKGELYHAEEDRWIYDEHRRQLNDHIQAHGDPRQTGGQWPIRYSMATLTSRFNAQFEGNTTLPGENGQPRPRRSQQSLDMRRRRIPNVTRDFGIPRSDPHPLNNPPVPGQTGRPPRGGSSRGGSRGGSGRGGSQTGQGRGGAQGQGGQGRGGGAQAG